MDMRHRLLLGVVTGLAVLAVPAAALGLTGGDGTPRPAPSNAAPEGPKWAVGTSAAQHSAVSAGLSGYRGYVALAGGYQVATVDAATHTIVAAGISTDTGEGEAVSPDGKTLYVANTGQYDVLAVDLASGKETPIQVGAFPQDVALSPDGRKLYATVTGGDTGAGGSRAVAVVDTRSGKVTRTINVGTSPRQVVVSSDGARAFVTFATGIAVIDTATDRVTRTIPDSDGPQGVATGDGSRVYVTNPRSGQVWIIDAARATGYRVTARLSVPDQPWAVAVTRGKLYVTRMNADAVAVLDASTGKLLSTVGVGKLPEAVGITPDGSEAWIGNDLSGTVSVISTATNTVTTTITSGTGTQSLDAAPLGIVFAKAP
jgi:YVTN family beta-propeller protein